MALNSAAIAFLTLIGVLNVLQVCAQPQESARAAFEVASVKPDKSPDRRPAMQYLPGGRLSMTNMPLLIIIATAYRVPFQSGRMSGGPDWIRSERYDIEAVAEKGALPAGMPAQGREERMRLMLRALLADRFKLAVRSETKELPVYALVVSKRGPKLQKAKIEETDCPEGPTDFGVSCHTFTGGQGRGVHGQAVSMSDLVLFVANWTDRPIIDRTGVQGLFNIQTEGWTPLLPRQGPPREGGEAEALADPTRPTLFSVLDQLGLKLETEKAPVEMFVIDHVERPSEN